MVTRTQICRRDLARESWTTVQVRLSPAHDASGRVDIWLNGAFCGAYQGPMANPDYGGSGLALDVVWLPPAPFTSSCLPAVPITDRPQLLTALVLLLTAAFIASGWIKPPWGIWWRRVVIIGYLLAIGVALGRVSKMAFPALSRHVAPCKLGLPPNCRIMPARAGSLRRVEGLIGRFRVHCHSGLPVRLPFGGIEAVPIFRRGRANRSWSP
jgi:hypothetical protein